MRRSSLTDTDPRRQRHGLRVVALVGYAALLYAALTARAEVSSVESLQAVEAARGLQVTSATGARIQAGWPSAHALAILAAHQFAVDDRPEGWERAARWVAVLSAVLLAVPLYLVALELFESSTAWLGTVLFLSCPMMGYVVGNLLSDGLFLPLWTWGLWAAIRFLRDGRWVWLALFVATTTGAASIRLDGVWLAASFWVVVVLMPWSWAAPVERSATWPAFLVLSVVLAGMVSPLASRLTAPGSPREPNAAAQIEAMPVSAVSMPASATVRRETRWQFWRRSVIRMLKVTRNAVGLRLVTFAVLGLLLAWSGAAQARVWLLLSLLLAGGLGLLVERRATLGDCSIRDALVPGLLLILAAGHGLGWLARRVRVVGTSFVCRPGPVVWLILLGGFAVWPGFRTVTPAHSAGSFEPYREAAAWLNDRGVSRSEVLDYTGWTTFQMPGGPALPRAAGQEPPHPKWLAVRQGQTIGRAAQQLGLATVVSARTPDARFPINRKGDGLEVYLYDLRPNPPAHAVARAGSNEKIPPEGVLRLISDEVPSNVKQ